MAPQRLDAEQQALEHALVREMTELLHDLLCGRITRADVGAWTKARQSQAGPFIANGNANMVYLSINDIADDTDPDRQTVREHDLRAYLRVLSEGQAFYGDIVPFVTLPGTLSDLNLPTWVEKPVRIWVSGLGWHECLQLGSPATGRPFYLESQISWSPDPPCVQIRKRTEDDVLAAALDLFETLAVDDRDALYLDPKIELSQFGCWELWRLDDNNNEALIDTFRSRAKAVLAQKRFEARGHRQSYWVAAAATAPK